MPQMQHPIVLADQSRLVLSPHLYGHAGSKEYLDAPNFPHNMEAIWDAHWGLVPEHAGVPVLVGEWGGLWESTEQWQRALKRYLSVNGVGFFCMPASGSNPRPAE